MAPFIHIDNQFTARHLVEQGTSEGQSSRLRLALEGGQIECLIRGQSGRETVVVPHDTLVVFQTIYLEMDGVEKW